MKNPKGVISWGKQQGAENKTKAIWPSLTLLKWIFQKNPQRVSNIIYSPPRFWYFVALVILRFFLMKKYKPMSGRFVKKLSQI